MDKSIVFEKLANSYIYMEILGCLLGQIFQKQ